MSILMSLFAALAEILGVVLEAYIWILVVGAVLSWLVAFNVVNTGNRFVRGVGDFCFRMTEPALRPLRRYLPPINGIDLSPLVLILAIMFIQSFVRNLLASL